MCFHSEEVPDGYRDVQLSVIFRGPGDLRIIGEVQIHDAELHSLKQKVSSVPLLGPFLFCCM